MPGVVQPPVATPGSSVNSLPSTLLHLYLNIFTLTISFIFILILNLISTLITNIINNPILNLIFNIIKISYFTFIKILNFSPIFINSFTVKSSHITSLLRNLTSTSTTNSFSIANINMTYNTITSSTCKPSSILLSPL